MAELKCKAEHCIYMYNDEADFGEHRHQQNMAA